MMLQIINDLFYVFIGGDYCIFISYYFLSNIFFFFFFHFENDKPFLRYKIKFLKQTRASESLPGLNLGVNDLLFLLNKILA